MVADPDPLDVAVRTLSRLLLADESLEATLSRVAGLACRTLRGCEMASVMMARDGCFATRVQTDEQAQSLDAAQHEQDAGPSLEAYRSRAVVRVDVATEARWPGFLKAAKEAGILSVLAVPLIVRDEAVGVLNLYSTSMSSFSEEDEGTARLFSEQAAVACANADVYWRSHSLTEHLREALESRDVIGQAKGILMARHGHTPDAAFAVLRAASMRRNIKLRTLAEEVVYTGELLG